MKINNTTMKKQVNEDLKIISGLYDYEPWSGAVDTWEKIVAVDMVDYLDRYLEDIYPDGLTKTELNDILWFDGEEVLRDLGISEGTEDDDEDYKEELSYADDYDVQKRHSIKEDIDDWRVGQTVFADGDDYKIVNTLDVKDVDGYELAVVALLPEDISNPRIDDPDFQYAVMLDDALEWGLCDTYDEAKEWYDGVNDGYYGDGSEYEDDIDWESYWEGEFMDVDDDHFDDGHYNSADDTFGESLDEDTIKKGKQWVNKGKAGAHGKVATKKKVCRRGNYMNEDAEGDERVKTFKLNGITYKVSKLEDSLGKGGYVARWEDDSDNGLGYNNRGWISFDKKNYVHHNEASKPIKDFIYVISAYDRHPKKSVADRLIATTVSMFGDDALDESLKLTEDKVLVSDEFIKKRDALADYFGEEGEVRYDKDMDLFILFDGRAYFVYTESEADAKAKEEVMSVIDDLGIEAFTPDFRQDIIDNQMVDVEWFDDAMRESYEAYADDIKDEEGEHGNRLFDEMIEEGIISETDVTEDGKLVDGIDFDEKKEEFVEKLCDGWDNGIEWYITNFGESDFSETCKEHDLFDYDAIADTAIRWDGRGHFISKYDGDEIYLGNDIFAYKYEEGWDYDKADDMVAESLTEDTVKTKDGKWANVGKDGKVDSGKFKTKKEADAQRKAIFASGWKGK